MRLNCFNWIKLVQQSDLPSNARYLCHYLATYMNANQDMAWPSLSRIETETGLGHATILRHLKLLSDRGWLVRHSGNTVESTRYEVSVPASVQIDLTRELVEGRSTTDPRRSTTDQARSTMDPGVGPPRTPNNNSNNNNTKDVTEKASVKRFTPPLIDDVKAYIAERGNRIDAEHWYDHYASNGWKVGKNTMKDWKAAVRTWERNAFGKQQNTKAEGLSFL